MQLASLCADGMRLSGRADVEVTGLAADSRAVRPGDLFAALPGARQDGARFVAEALARGAVAVLPDPATAEGLAVPVLVAAEPRAALARAAARFFGRQPRTAVAVTGTSGKTSIVTFTRQLWQGLGLPAASIGTLGVQTGDAAGEESLTTPDPIALHRACAQLASAGIEHLAVEASSHGLHQHRLDGLVLRAAAFSNLSRDHFDYHGSVEAYWAAKRHLFEALLPRGGTLVSNADAPEHAQLVALAEARALDLLDFGVGARRLRLVEREAIAHGQRLVIEALGRRHVFESRLVGAFQAHNLLAALGLALGSGSPLDALLPQLAALAAPPGRMQLVALHPSGAPAFVDYAHKPEALAKALEALRPHATGRLVVVVGCGGDRDPGKRPLMGAIAAKLADAVVVTDDNPRGEDPAAIRRAVLTAAPAAREIGDRAEAIGAAFASLAAGDVLLVAGKGHETYQIVGGRKLPFDDALELRRAAKALGGREP